MKKIVAFFCAILICGVVAAQEKIDLYKFIEDIEWNSTREQVIEKYQDIIIPDSLVDRSLLVKLTGIKSEKDDIFVKDIKIGDIASRIAVLSFFSNRLSYVSIAFATNTEYGADSTKSWNVIINQNLNENLGEEWIIGFFGYFFHRNALIHNIGLSNLMNHRSLSITPPSPRYEKDFRVANWGDSKEKIINLEGRTNMSNDRDLYYFEDRLGELKCKIVYKFTNNRLIWAKYIFDDIKEDRMLYHYQHLEQMLDEKYGIAQYDGTKWKDSKYEEEYKDKEIDAIKYKYLEKYKFWCNGPTLVYLGFGKNQFGSLYITIEYHGREMEKVQDKAVFDAL